VASNTKRIFDGNITRGIFSGLHKLSIRVMHSPHRNYTPNALQ